MKKIVQLVLLIILLSLNFISLKSELILSDNIRQNDTLTIEYRDFLKEFTTEQIIGFIYVFSRDEVLPRGYNVQMNQDSLKQIYVGKFVIPNDAVFALIKFVSGNTVNNNEHNYWDFLVRTDDNKPIKGANYRAAISYLGNLSENYKRTPNFNKAIKYLEEENKLYPDYLLSIIAKLSLKYELGEIQKTEFEQNVRKLISDFRVDYTNEDEVNSTVKLLRIIGETKRADELEAKFAVNYPNSKTAIKMEFEKLSNINDFDYFVDKSLLFLRKYKGSEYEERVYLGLIQSYFQMGEIDKLINLFRGMVIPDAISFQLAENLLNNKDININLSNQELQTSINELIYNGLNSLRQKQLINPSLTPLENENSINSRELDHLIMLIDFYKKFDKPDSVNYITLNILNKYELNLFNINQLKKIIKLIKNTDNYSYLFDLTTYALLLDNKDSNIINLNKNLFKMIYPNKIYITYLDSLNNIIKQNNLKGIKTIYLSQSIIYPAIKTLDDINVSLKVFQGRIIVIYAFAFFCDQCWDVFNDIEKLFNEYAENKDVLILPVLLWEKDKNEIKQIANFSSKNNLKVPIYYDYLNEVYRNLSITGVPTVAIIGKNGDVNFRIEGIPTEKSIYSILKDYLNYLKN